VFVNEKIPEVQKAIKSCALDMIQLHGDESPDYCRQFPPSIIIKALELKNHEDLSYALNYNTAAIMVDSRQAGLYGGTGKKSNWELACRLRSKKPLILSGGLNEKNIVEAIKMVTPAGLDINSGVEKSPGVKDHLKLCRLFEIIRDTDAALANSTPIFKKKPA
jgi:phosphoribosylanthranilate isomerase